MRAICLCIFFLLIILVSCKDDMQDGNEFIVSGKVIDTLGAGIQGVKVYYTTDSCVLTDVQGFWQSRHIVDSATITPVDSNYVFSPAFMKVNHETSGLVFTGHRVQHQNQFTANIYSWFSSMQLPNGLLESAENSNVVSLYDNALAVMVYLAKGDNAKAEAVLDFFNNRIDNELLAGKGGFSQFRDRNGNPNGNYWLGDNSWLLIALNNYTSKVDNIKYLRLQQELTKWIRSLQDTDGSIWGGFDLNGNKIGKVTEGMIDAFNAVTGYDTFHQHLLSYLNANRWNPTEKLLVSWPGNKYVYALDNHSWGYCAFEDFPGSVLQKADMYITTQTATATGKSITGYCFDIDKDDIWLEGTGEMVVAFQKAGQNNQADFYLSEMEKLIVESAKFPGYRGIPYVSNRGTGYATDALWAGSDTKPCISSGAWYLFGVLHFDPFAIGYSKNIPSSDKFWK